MDFLTFNQFAVLLWKNFTIKRRHYINLLFEVLTAVVFPMLLLLFRSFATIQVAGPQYFKPLRISGLPSFLQNPQEWELIYVPSNINVVKEIIENMKRNLNISIKVKGFYSESEFEKYVKYDYKSQKVLAAIVFDNDFENINDSLPLQVKYHLRFVRIPRTIQHSGPSDWKTSLLFPIHPFSGPRNPNNQDGGSPAHLAASAGSFLYFASFFPFKSIIGNYGQITIANKVAACLSSNVALALGINLLLNLEIKEIGLKWNNLWTRASLEDNLIFGYMMGMLLLDAFLYGLVTWYIEAVFPGQYGVSQPWNFFLMRSYWYGRPGIRRKEEDMKGYGRTQSKYFEAEPTGLVASIQIKHLHKEFGAKVAVNNMSLNLYKGQITVLLGENGAGKTVTLSILTGCHPPTRGEVYVNGYPISKNLTDIRKNFGFCPQHDLLFNDLTLSEHLYFYFMVVILDEPTISMDPISQRATWDLLHQYKQDRTILMTTHHIDEADILGDRIAIMVKGTLHCCGSSVFLKQIYGATYRIVMEIDPQCDVEKLSALIRSHIPQATLEECTGAELSFILPKEYIHRFEALFNDLKEKKSELGITSFDASVTTMEEVFHNVTDVPQFLPLTTLFPAPSQLQPSPSYSLCPW
ncbi:PREDICTED: ATP-binding cassette sub-family A member 3, partial [Myotis brandtii]|uniref:ATP-binding cassette sub-family A member 3 n=1 Tax=Myotis brandtii TaxID=109478 RepID=UPI000703F238